MTWLIAGLVLFLGAHSIQIFGARLREAAVRRVGPGPWKGLYSLVSLAGFGLIIFGYARARGAASLYALPPALLHPAALLICLGFVCVVAAYWPANHVKRWLGDPMVFGVGLWALGHLLVNASPSALALFGAVLVWAIVDYISLRGRGGVNAPAPAKALNTVLVIVVGSILAGVFALWLHRPLIGVAPFG